VITIYTGTITTIQGFEFSKTQRLSVGDPAAARGGSAARRSTRVDVNSSASGSSILAHGGESEGGRACGGGVRRGPMDNGVAAASGVAMLGCGGATGDTRHERGGWRHHGRRGSRSRGRSGSGARRISHGATIGRSRSARVRMKRRSHGVTKEKKLTLTLFLVVLASCPYVIIGIKIFIVYYK